MIREFALVVFDKNQEVISRFALEKVTDPKALGFSLTASTIKSEATEIIVQLAQELKPISMNVIFESPNAYQKMAAFRAWIEKNALANLSLEYRTENGTLFCDCVVSAFEFSEMDIDGSIKIPITLKTTTPFWKLVKNQIVFYPAADGKSYPFVYPYAYGKITIENNIIENQYIKETPLIIQIFGPFTDPIVHIMADGVIYGTIEFIGVTVAKNQCLIVDSIRHKVELYDGGTNVDYYDFLNPEKQSFLYARPQTISKLSVNFGNSAYGWVTATYRQYKL